MATFDERFRKAYRAVLAAERRRVDTLLESGFPTYRDLIAIGGGERYFVPRASPKDIDAMMDSASACRASVDAIDALASLATEMGKAMNRQAEELKRTARKVRSRGR
jgi:protein-disulfide isomerase-like protein with CxxC motif